MQLNFSAKEGPALPHVDPLDVTHDPCLTKAEKRALLASWASDARAIANAPGLRRLDTGAVVHIDRIFEALRAIDEGEAVATPWPSSPLTRSAPLTRGRAKRRRWRSWKGGFRRRGGDDDGMPPVPVAARPRRPTPLVDAVAMQPY